MAGTAAPPSPDAPTPPSPTDPAAADAPRRRRQGRVVVGLLLSFLGLFFATLLLPASPGALLAALPTAAVALFVLWVGGVVLGSARGLGARAR